MADGLCFCYCEQLSNYPLSSMRFAAAHENTISAETSPLTLLMMARVAGSDKLERLS